ncbi:MAG: EAL domain-containing protein [Pseudomonadota bacterium]|nr:EAL domain-containing protein [Pseudomonadota bacterium]
MEDSAISSTALQNPKHRERLLTMLLSELDGMVYLCRVDRHWTMEFISQGCRALTGYSRDDLLLNRSLSFNDIIHPEDRERVWECIAKALAEERAFSVEYRILHADRSERWVWERGRGILQPGAEHRLLQGFIQDITERHLREKALIEAEQRYRNIFENATEGIFQTTLDGHYLEVNGALARIYGFDSPVDMVHNLHDIGQQLYVLPRRRDEFIRLMQEKGVVVNFESQVFRRDGTVIWISENAHEVRDTDGRLRYYEGTVEDITERKAYEQLIAHQATHDTLTGLPNRALILERIDHAIRRARDDDSGVAVVFIDLDHFKNVNDSLGHNAGDEMIRTVAERLRACLREHDTVARLGGDEFVLLLTDIRRDMALVSRAVARLLEAIEQPCTLAGREYLITCSLGVSFYPTDGVDAETLLKNADLAMYKAKASGRNAYRFYTPELNLCMAERLELEQQLRVAINERQFELHYQGKYDLASGRLTGAEALVRWRRPGDLEPMLPDNFIALAEDTGLINPLGLWVLEEACRQMRQWLDAGLAVVPMAVNLSARQFQQQGLVGQVEAALRASGLPPELLVLEVTESCLVLDEAPFVDALLQLRRLGVAIALDDFGTGYSNMQSLKTMPVSWLKIDRSFIAGVERDERDRAIYRAVVAMARQLDLRVVAEGVENAGQYEFLRHIGCDEAQGFYCARPLVARRFERLLPAGARMRRGA